MLTGRSKMALLVALALFGANTGARSEKALQPVVEASGGAPRGERRAAPPTPAPRLVPPPAPKPLQPPRAKKETRTEQVLREWAEANQKRQVLEYRFSITTRDNPFGEKTIQKGYGLLKRPHLFRVETSYKGEPADVLIGTEQSLQHYRGKDRTVLVFPTGDERPALPWLEKLSRAVPKANAEMFFLPLVASSVHDLSTRCEVQLVKEDRWYVYLDVRPKPGKNARDFTRRRIVVDREHYRVRHTWTEHATGEVMIDFQYSQAPAVTRERILHGLPTDWKRVTVGAPRPAPKN